MCKLTVFLIKLCPVRPLRERWLDRHFSLCPHCGELWEPESSLSEYYRQCRKWAESRENLWPAVRRTIADQTTAAAPVTPKEIPRKTPGRIWRLAAAGAALILAAVLTISINRNPIEGGLKEDREDAAAHESPRIQVIYGSVKGEKAEPYVYQTQKASFVWFGTVGSGG